MSYSFTPPSKVICFSGLALCLPVIAPFAPAGTVLITAIAAVALLLDPGVRSSLMFDVRSFKGWLWALPLVWALMTSLWSPNPLRSVKVWLSLSALLAIGAVLTRIASSLTNEQRGRVSDALIIGGGLTFLALLSEFLDGGMVTKVLQGYSGMNTDDHMPSLNRGGAILAVLAWPIVGALEKQGRRRLGVAAFILILILVALSRTKAPSLALALSAGVFLAVTWRQQASLVGVATFLAVAVLGLPSFLGLALEPESVRLQLSEISATWEHRTIMWQFAIDRINEAPVFGWGLDASRFMEGAHEPVEGFYGKIFTETMPLHPHNAFLQVWLELGAFGAMTVAAVLAAIPFLIRRATETKQACAMFMATLTTFLIVGQFSFGAWQNWWLATAVLATVFSVVIFGQERKG